MQLLRNILCLPSMRFAILDLGIRRLPAGLRRRLMALRPREWPAGVVRAARSLARSKSSVLYTLLGLSLLVRLPFIFTSTDGYMRDVAVTFHDEAMFLESGRDVLRGHLPYMEHWDNATPLQWYVYGLITLVTLGKLTLFRLLGSLCIGTTAYVLWSLMTRRNKTACGWWAAGFYIVFGSTLQAGQSFTLEHLLGLPLALMLHLILAPPAWSVRKQRRWMLGLMAFTGGIAMSFVCMIPAIALLFPQLFAAKRKGAGWQAGAFLVRCLMLLMAGAVPHMFFALVYLLAGELHYYVASAFEASFYLASVGSHSPVLFFRQYGMRMMNSNQWLLLLFIVGFMLKAVLLLVQRRARYEPFVYRMTVLGVCALAMVYFRGNNNSYFMFYFIQAMPVFALIMGYTVHINLADLRWFAMLVCFLGVSATTQAVQSSYLKMVPYWRGDASDGGIYADRLYRVVELMSVFDIDGETLLVCGEDDMLFPMTGMKNPRFFLFPFHAYNQGLHKILDRWPPSLRNIIHDKAPLYIVGRDADPLTNRGLMEIGDLLYSRYVQVSNIDGTVIYLRKNKLQNLFTK